MIEKNNGRRDGGFTLIELLVVIMILGIMSVTVYVALDPSKRFADARDSKRWTDVDNISSAINKYTADHDGQIPSGITETGLQIGTDFTGCSGSNGCSLPPTEVSCLNLSGVLAPYLKSIPFDPKYGSPEKSGYVVYKDTTGIVTVYACSPEGSGVSVSISR